MPEKTAFFYFYLTFCLIPGEISGLVPLSDNLGQRSGKKSGTKFMILLASLRCADTYPAGCRQDYKEKNLRRKLRFTQYSDPQVAARSLSQS